MVSRGLLESLHAIPNRIGISMGFNLWTGLFRMSKELDILIIEDVPSDAEAIELELKEENIPFQTRRLENGPDLLKALEEKRPDVILSDFSLPEFDALEALRILQDTEYQDVPFILVTGTRSEEVAVECIRHGADDYILKASLKRLPSSIQNALKKKAALRQKARTEEALRQRDQQIRLIAEHSRDFIGLLDGDGHFLYASPSFETGLGFPPRELLGRSCFDLAHQDDRLGLREAWSQARDSSGGWTAEFRWLHREGNWRTLEASGSWILDPSGDPKQSVLLARDITLRKEAEEALRNLPRLIRDAQETERRRVARELHDGVIQILSSVRFRLQAVEEKLKTSESALQADTAKAEALLEKAIGEIRHISRNLRPSELDDLGLVPALRALGDEFSERTEVNLSLNLEEIPREIPGETKLNLYRIVQESLANIEKHAEAKNVAVDLECSQDSLSAVVQDDGRGFNPSFPDLGEEENAPKPGMGLMDIRERAAICQGHCDIDSAPGQGTRILVAIPLPPASEETSEPTQDTLEQGTQT